MTRRKPVRSERNPDEVASPLPSHRWNAYRVQLRMLAATFGISILLVWSYYHPADSTALQQGFALEFCVGGLLVAGLALFGSRPGQDPSNRSVCWLAGSLAGWLMLSSLVTSWNGDLRTSMNVAWLFVTGAAVFCAVQRTLVTSASRHAILGVILFGVVLMSVHTLHQYFVSLPQTLRDYQLDPEGTLALIGLDFPPGSAERMIFENRLRDGGPTATFALANTLAGLLAAGASLLAGVIFQHCRATRTIDFGWKLVFYLGVLVVVTIALWSTGSRGGLLSVPVVCFGAGVYWYGRDRIHAWPIRSAGWVLLTMAGAGILWLTRSMWVTRVPATIQLRFQYWSATLAMLRDYPLLGIGPGNFQTAYQRYRDLRAHETIAEPHHFFFETLAAGGLIAGVILLALMAAAVVVSRRNALAASLPSSPTVTPRSQVWLFGSVACVAVVGTILVVWAYGISVGQPPDFSAHQFAVPIALLVGCLWWYGINPDTLSTRGLAQLALLTLGVHLSLSGGWLIPGVATTLWVLAGIYVAPLHVLKSTAEPIVPRRFWRQFIASAVCVLLAGVLVFVSLRPVRKAEALLAEASELHLRGRSEQALAKLRDAMQVDLDAFAPAQWILQLQVAQSDRDSLASVLPDALERAAEDPARLRVIADVVIHRYQIFGEVTDLQDADRVLRSAADLSPTHQGILAQWAEVARQLGELGEETVNAREIAARASIAAASGGVVTRSLNLQSILLARPLGGAAQTQPVRAPADEVLEELL